MVRTILNEYLNSDLSININMKTENHHLETISYEEEIIIIDNNLYSFAKNLSNGILISSFTGNQADEELFDILEFIDEIKDKNDSFVERLEKHFCFGAILNAIKENVR